MIQKKREAALEERGAGQTSQLSQRFRECLGQGNRKGGEKKAWKKCHAGAVRGARL